MKKILLLLSFVFVITLSWCFFNKTEQSKQWAIVEQEKTEESWQEKKETDTKKENQDLDQEKESKHEEEKKDQKKEEVRDEFNEEGEFEPKKFQDKEIDEVMGLLKDLLEE